MNESFNNYFQLLVWYDAGILKLFSGNVFYSLYPKLQQNLVKETSLLHCSIIKLVVVLQGTQRALSVTNEIQDMTKVVVSKSIEYVKTILFQFRPIIKYFY